MNYYYTKEYGEVARAPYKLYMSIVHIYVCDCVIPLFVYYATREILKGFVDRVRDVVLLRFSCRV